MLAVSSLTYIIARSQVRRDREQLLGAYARQIKQDVEKELRDALHEVQFWGELNYSPDSFKRLDQAKITTFLDDLLKHYQEYDLIFMSDASGRITYANGLAAPFLGKPYYGLIPQVPVSLPAEVIASKKTQGLDWHRLDRINALHNRRPDTPLDQQYQITLAAPIKAHDGTEILGVVFGVLNWSSIQRVLDRAQWDLSALDLHSGYAFLLDGDSDTTIGHKYRDQYGISVSRNSNLPQLRNRARDNPKGIIPYHCCPAIR